MSLCGSLTVGYESRIFQTGGLDVTQRFGVHKVNLDRLRVGALPLGFFKTSKQDRFGACAHFKQLQPILDFLVGLKQELLEQLIEVVVVTTPKFL